MSVTTGVPVPAELLYRSNFHRPPSDSHHPKRSPYRRSCCPPSLMTGCWVVPIETEEDARIETGSAEVVLVTELLLL